MEIDLVWLFLLPVIFALGWMTARYDWRQQRREASHVSDDILQSLSLILAGELDRATQSLLTAARTDPDNTGLHQSVGDLYRQRGFVDRAMEVHESALRHPSITRVARDALILSLGRDYLAAGLFDRAEEVLVDLLNHSPKLPEVANDARYLLMGIAQRTRDWERAIYWAQAAHQHGANFEIQSYEQLMGHFYCECAEKALMSENTTAAEQALVIAQTFDAPGPLRRSAELRVRMERITLPKSPTEADTAELMACSICGFRSRQSLWQCPGCHCWDSFRPSRH